MKTRTLLLIPAMLFMMALKTDKPAYKLFDLDGKHVKYQKMVKAAQEADIIMFGELHNNPIGHWLQLQLTKDVHAEAGDALVLGAEMFEADNQLLLTEYLNEQIKEKSFEKEARLWNNYKTDYKPLVMIAKDNGLAFVATNIPRRYASVVHKSGFEGLDGLSDEAKSYIAPLPIKFDPDLPGYKNMIEMMADMPHAKDTTAMPLAMDTTAMPDVTDYIARAQAIKDATMAHFILENWSAGKVFIHYNGAYHSNDFEGIVWYLKDRNPDLKIVTITSVEQDDIETLEEENLGVADFTVCVPSDMTKTYR